MATISPSPKMQFFDNNGNPLVGGKLYTYQAGTLNPQVTYTNAGGGTPNTNPIILDSRGEADIWLGSADLYKYVLKTAADTSVWTVDNIGGSVTAFDLAGPNGASMVGYRDSRFTASLGSLADRIHDWDAVADCGADPTGAGDSTIALNTWCDGMTNNCTAVLPPGTYKYTPVIGGSGTGVCFLNIIGVSNLTIVAYGATIINSFVVTTAPNNAGHNYGVNIQDCNDVDVLGLTFNGNRDTTFGTNGDGNEFYSGFTVRGCNRVNLIDCAGINCQGDGYTIGRTATGTLGSENNVVRGYWSRNRRNNGSIDANFGGRVTQGTYVDAGYGHGTNPQAHIDCEWEHATIGPVGNNVRMVIDGPDFSGVGVVGLYIPNTSGVTATNVTCSMSTAGAAVTIDSTNVNYATLNTQILGWKMKQTAGVNIVTSGGAGVSEVLVANCNINCVLPVVVNTSNGTAGNAFPISVVNNEIIGESTFAVKVLAGRTKFHGNKCINSASGGGDNFLALFRPLCDVQGNQWERNSDQSAPTYGVVISTNNTIFENNSINGITITHPVAYGENSTPAYPTARTNYRNGALLPDLRTTYMFMSPSIDASSATPVAIYIPNNGLNKVLDAQIIVGKSGANVSSTTTLSLGIVGSTAKYLNALALPGTQIGAINDIQSSLALAVFDNQVPVFAQIATGNTSPFINIGLTMGYDTASLYTATVLFS